MEFKFPVNDIFKGPIVEINQNLVPPGFTGSDRRGYWDAVSKVSEVVNAMGEASAAAQGLTKPITTAERLRNSEHTVYLLIDPTVNNGRGAITGMLKTGKKGLYVFDRNGQHFQVSPPCVLDFYVHEARQRTGLGKRLFEHMLQTENVEPVKMAIDRPSDKFLGFLNKHYTLVNPVKQMNNYVVFDGFFPDTPEKNAPVEVASPRASNVSRKQSANGLQHTMGRYGAPRPTCSMGQIIHNQTSTIAKTPEPIGSRTVINQAEPPKESPPTPQSNPGVNTQYTNYQQQSQNMWQNFNNEQNNLPVYGNAPNYGQNVPQPGNYAPPANFVQNPQFADQQYTLPPNQNPQGMVHNQNVVQSSASRQSLMPPILPSTNLSRQNVVQPNVPLTANLSRQNFVQPTTNVVNNQNLVQPTLSNTNMQQPTSYIPGQNVVQSNLPTPKASQLAMNASNHNLGPITNQLQPNQISTVVNNQQSLTNVNAGQPQTRSVQALNEGNALNQQQPNLMNQTNPQAQQNLYNQYSAQNVQQGNPHPIENQTGRTVSELTMPNSTNQLGMRTEVTEVNNQGQNYVQETAVDDVRGDTQVVEELVSSSPKLERPRSLSIQANEEPEDQKQNNVESAVQADEPEEILEKLAISENDADKIDPGARTPGRKTPSHLTEQGFFDLKFYHNKLW